MTTAESIIRGTIGSILIGSQFATTLYGFATLQTYCYYMNYPNDASPYKTMVGLLWLVNTLHTVFICHVDYFYLIEAAFDSLLLIKVVWSVPAVVALHLVIFVIVSLFFIWQIFQVCRSTIRSWLTGTLLFMLLCNVGLGIAVVFRLSQCRTLADLHNFTPIMLGWNAAHLVPDALISVSLIVLLRTQRGSVSNSRKLLNTLVIYALNRYLLSSSVTLAELIAILRSSDNLWYAAVEFILPGVYTNTLLATLNARQSLREEISSHGVVNSIHLPNFSTDLREQEDSNTGTPQSKQILGVSSYSPEIRISSAGSMFRKP